MIPEIVNILPSCLFLQTGSRVFGDATEASDWDWVVLVKGLSEEFQQTIMSHGFDLCHDAYSDDDHFIVRRARDNVNLIFTDSPEKFEMWRVCTHVSLMLALTKEQRKVLFSAFIDAE